MRKIFKMGAAFKRIMALALAFVLVLGYIPAEVSAEEATKTVYVGVIEWITNYVPEIHYWNNSGLADDVVLTSTGKTVSAYAGDGYWSDNQIFHVYTAEVPAAATNMKTWDQDTNGYWAAEDEICQSNKMLLLFEWGGIHHNTTIDCPHPVHGTDGNCSACGTAVGHSYDSTGLCGCSLQAEALVNDTTFTTFVDAIQTVNQGGTIKLLTDVTTETVNGNNGHNLDLNGKTLTVSELWAPSTSFLRIQDNTTAQEGKIVGDVYTSQYLYLEGGTIEGTVWLTSYSQLKGSFTMTGGAIKADTDIYINTDGASVKLQGGEFTDGLKIGNNTSVATPMTLADTISPDYRFYQNGSVVDMTGITDTISGSTVTVQTHTHTYSSATGFCPCGDECAHSSKTNGVCDTCGMADAHTHEYVDGACSCGKTAQVLVTYSDSTTKYFDTLQAALDTFSKNNSFAYVKLLTNIAVGDNISADTYTRYTLDLNGYSLTAERLIVPASGGMEIMDTSAGQTGQINAIVHAQGPLTIWSGTFNDTVLVTTMSNVKGSVTIRDGKFTAATDFQIADDGCSLSLWSGTFPGGIKVEAINGATKDELAGFLYNNNAYFQNCEKVTLTAGQSEISGGHVVVAYDAKHQFGSNTECSYCGLDAIVSMSLDGVTTYYGTVYDLQQDLVQENAGCTIQLLADITTTYFSDKDGRCGFYLDLNGHTLTASDGVSLPGSSGCTIMDTSAEKNGKIVGTVYAAYSTALTGGTIEGTVSFPKKASATGYTFQMEGGAIHADMDFGINDNNTTIVLTGGTFPGGISIACGDNVTTPKTLADCISGNYKYFKDGSVVTLTEGQTEITGGDVTVAEHTGHTHTYNAEGFCEGILPDTYAVCGSYEKPEGAGTEASPYIIDNAGKLFWFAAVVNGGYEDTQGNSAAWAKVTEEITIPEGMAWTPISGYTGTFDGGSKTISGMTCASDATYVGMFSRTGKCTIQNVYLSDSSFESTDVWGSVGAIAGYAGETDGNSTVISGCSVSNTTVTGYTAGGIAGTLYGFSEISNSNPDCTVNAEGEGGGAVGRCQSGSEIQWVSAQGTVTGNYAGGVVGYVVNDVGPYESRTNDVLLSTFTGSVGSENTTYAGGIIGFVSDGTKASINNCSVKCSVTAKYAVTSQACGLLGHSDNDTTGAVTVSNSFTIDTTLGVANINKASLASGGVTVTNCYSDDAVNPLVVSGRTTDCAVKTDEQFKSGEVAYLLDAPQTTHAWGQNIDNGNQNYGFPVRGQHKVYQVVADCRGSVGYSNTESTETPSHNYVNGFCTNEAEGVVCDAYEPAVPVTSENYTELGLTEDYVGYYAITNAGQLYWFADKVDNENDTYKTANVVLTADITVNTGTMDANTTGAREWNPIGYWVSGRDYAAFNGTFDGNNKKISGLYFNNTESTTGRNAALIAETESGALVKNVTVTNTWFHGYGQVAGIVGDNGGTITGCVSEASLSCTWSYIGGVAGWNEGTITGCINRGTIAGSYNNSGGIVGHNAGTVELCGNEGSISDNWCYAGGIVGNNAGIIRNCWNTGEIYVTNNIAGGITGMNNSDDLVENCWSTGVVSCGRDSEAIGGIVGRSQSAIQKNCYSLMEPVGQIKDKDGGSASTVENMDPITLEQLASGEVAYLLRIRAAEGTDVWGQNIDNGETVQTVPALNGADVYYGYFDCASTEAKLTNTAVSATPVEHSYDNGFCTNELTDGTVCDAYQPAELLTAARCAELGLDATYEGYYAVKNAGNLYWFADKVDNENAAYASVNVVLTDDITVNSGTVTAESTGLRAWNPIGYYHYDNNTNTVDNRSFNGIFDGNNKTVSGLYLNDPELEYAGLIARTGAGFQVKNMTLSNSYINGKECVGGIVGYGSDGTIIGCVNNATIRGSGDNRVGGIVGEIYSSTITGCVNNGNIYGETAGGIVGSQYSTPTEQCVNTGAISGESRTEGCIGGIAGYAGGLIRNCENSGTITSYELAGGIAASGGTIENCGNAGKVTGDMAGGIGGSANAMNCWNTGAIHGISYAGGVMGYTEERWSSAEMENCWSTGAVTCDENGIAGGIVGYSKCAGQTVKNSYSVMEPIGQIDEGYGAATVTDVESKTLEQFTSGEVAYLLRTRAAEGTNAWGQDLDNGKTVQTVPTFDGADVYRINANCAGTIGYSNTNADKVSHVPTHVPAVAATCTEEGNIEHWSCVCGKFFAEEACTTELAAEDISVQPTGHTYGAEGTCININNGVVCGHGAGASLTTKTGGTEFFDTLQEALDAAKTTVAADEAVVKVLKDVVNTDKISAVKAKGGVFTLDVGDAKLVGDDYGLSVENAIVTITGNTGYIDCIYGLYSDLIIDGVTVKAQQSSSTAINMQYCNLTVKSGSVINNKYGGYAILGYGEDYEIVIEGGTITATGTAGKGIALMGGTTVSVTGGIIHAVEDIITMDGLCSLSGVLAGGSFPGGLYLKEDYREPNMNEVLADGFAYWQQDVQVDVDDDAESIQGDVVIKSDCKHPSITCSASGYVLTADCDTCSAASALELIPQTDAEKIYSGTEKSAAYTGSILGLDTVPVTYTGDRVNVGSFTASVTVGGAAVEMPMEIVPYELEVKTFTLADKVYDGTNTCAVTSLSFVSTANGEELVQGTDFTAKLTFPAADAGDYTDAVLTVELMPTALASNYILKSDTVTGISHSIDPAAITVTDVKVAEKVYDGTTDATVTSVTASGIVAGDDVKVEVQAAFADKNSGTDKPVNLTYTLSGADAGNYVLAEETGRTTTSITVKPLEEIVEPVKDLSVDNVTSDDKETLEDVKEELEFVLTDEGLSDEQRKEREDALQDVQDMLDRIQDAADAITTDPIMDTKDITADNITLDDREDVEQALEDLHGALEDYENNYTDAEKEGIHDDIERLEAALAALKQVEDLIKDIEELPDEVQPDTPYRKDILEAKDAYDALDDHQKDLVPEEIVQKLNDLLADLKVYLIIEGDGQTWTDGDLSFTANGPFDLFMELKIDGITVAASNYTAVSGSTVLTLKESYVETLTAGKHSIKFVYPDGEAVGSFTVEIPTNGSATTGDEAPILLLAVMMSVSLAGALMLLERKRKV